MHFSNEISTTSFSSSFSAADNIRVVASRVLTFIQNAPQYCFLMDLFSNGSVDRNDYPFFRFRINHCHVDFAFSVYHSVISAVLAYSPSTSLDYPFTHDIDVDLTLLYEHEFPSAPPHPINQKVSFTPVTAMPELVFDASSALCAELKVTSRVGHTFCALSLSDTAVTLAATLASCFALHSYIAHYGTSYLWPESETPLEAVTIGNVEKEAAKEEPTATAPVFHQLDSASFVNTALDALLVDLLSDSCVVLGRLLPAWLETALFTMPMLFSFATRKLYLYPRRIILTCSDCYAFDAYTSYTNLCDMCHPSLYALPVQPMVSIAFSFHPQLIRYTTLRQNPVYGLVEISSVFDNTTAMQVCDQHRTYIQVKFYGEDGVGNGPTNECLTLFFHEILRRSLHLWNESGETPYAVWSTARMLHYPPRGPEATGLEDLREDELNGVLLQCGKCAYLKGYSCPEHHCLLSADRERSGRRVCVEG